MQTTSSTQKQPISAALVPDALLKISTVSAIVGLSATAIRRRVSAGEFPQPIRFGSRCTRWRAGDITSWLKSVAGE